MSNTQTFDVVVIGGGPGGSVTAAYLGKQGYKILLIEKAKFPRFHIGESLTGMAAQILADFDLESKMKDYDFPVKGGVKVLGKEAKSEFFVSVLRKTWQVRRADFDTMLLENAAEHGVTIVQGMAKDVLKEGDRVVGVTYEKEGKTSIEEVHAKFVVDASGSGTFLSKKKVAGQKKFEKEFKNQVATFSHFKNVKRDPGAMRDNTFLFYGELSEWAWFIPVSDDTVSIGVVMPSKKVQSLGGPEKTLEWGIKNINPDLCERMESAELDDEVRAINNYSYTIEPFVGEGWLCIGDAHRFSDPIFSFGVSFAMVEAKAAAMAIDKAITSGNQKVPFTEFANFSETGQNAALDVIKYFWHFPVFFGFLSKGKHRKEMIRLLSSDCFKSDEMEVLQLMRKSLRKKEQEALEEATV